MHLFLSAKIFKRICSQVFRKISQKSQENTHDRVLKIDFVNSESKVFSHQAIADELFECVWPFCGIGA